MLLGFGIGGGAVCCAATVHDVTACGGERNGMTTATT